MARRRTFTDEQRRKFDQSLAAVRDAVARYNRFVEQHPGFFDQALAEASDLAQSVVVVTPAPTAKASSVVEETA